MRPMLAAATGNAGPITDLGIPTGPARLQLSADNHDHGQLTTSLSVPVRSTPASAEAVTMCWSVSAVTVSAGSGSRSCGRVRRICRREIQGTLCGMQGHLGLGAVRDW